MRFIVIFFVSFLCILLELFWTRMISLKAWNHVLYTVIPFAILGYGIGANIVNLNSRKLLKIDPDKVMGWILLAIALVVTGCTYALISLPIRIDDLLKIFSAVSSIGMLLAAYTIFMLPFIFIGFLVVYLFIRFPKDMNVLYFVDLVGAGIGAAAFAFLIDQFAVVRSLLIVSGISCVIGAWILAGRRRWAASLGTLAFVTIVIVSVGEPLTYAIDARKGWEYIPGFFKADQYELVSARWHPLGRTDIFRITGADARKYMLQNSPGTFQINVVPPPEHSYFSTNFLAGTPVFRLADLSDPEKSLETKSFVISMEAPYLLLKQPKVFIIGVGGGRDIFMARTHNAREIIGAEINPGIVRAMAKGGEMYDYSARIYDAGNVQAIDGRHLVKRQASGSFDLIVLNGVDTFSGLSSGAYAYAESYLYTKNAIDDYLRVLNDNGMIYLNRWLFSPPRETIRLQAIALESLRTLGVEKPWEHIFIAGASWSTTLIKKTPFTTDEIRTLSQYFQANGMVVLYPMSINSPYAATPFVNFQVYADAFRLGQAERIAKDYPYDISVVTDDNPFFYKYYKFDLSMLLKPEAVHHTGSVVFWTQFLILCQSLFFIVLFIFAPLWWSRKAKQGPQVLSVPFVGYFASLGAGFMLIEIPVMQKFVLLLGSPIYSISVVLAALLVWTGVGSFLLPMLEKRFKVRADIVSAAAFVLIGLIFLLLMLGSGIVNAAIAWPFALRIALALLLLAPFGIVLGLFFPAGLRQVSAWGEGAVAWAWGINCGFSVLGSVIAIILAQFWGFSVVIVLAGVIYLLGILAFARLKDSH